MAIEFCLQESQKAFNQTLVVTVFAGPSQVACQPFGMMG
jgi:hypothetical protein